MPQYSVGLFLAEGLPAMCETVIKISCSTAFSQADKIGAVICLPARVSCCGRTRPDPAAARCTEQKRCCSCHKETETRSGCLGGPQSSSESCRTCSDLMSD